MKSVQITIKYRCQMLKKEHLKFCCKPAIEEACRRWKTEVVILKILPEHSHLIVVCSRTVLDAKLMQIIKGLSSYLKIKCLI